GKLWFGTSGGVSCYDGKTWATLTTEDGLADKEVKTILQDREGHFWFGTVAGGVSRYDARTFRSFTTEEGLADNRVNAMIKDREGTLWFGTEGGVSRYDGKTWTTGHALFLVEIGEGYQSAAKAS
ncbi:MAG: two-component regulator propeller domain-containing protein, partial [Arenicellales bacterium]|nr:two-component regulator propeller domain-containing protein [Arenicellales bacterium]